MLFRFVPRFGVTGSPDSERHMGVGRRGTGCLLGTQRRTGVQRNGVERVSGPGIYGYFEETGSYIQASVPKVQR